MRIEIFGLLAAVTLALGACADRTDPSLQEDPAYQLGYSDGCASVDRMGGVGGQPIRNRDYAGKSRAYDAGWSAGYGACGGQPYTGRRDPGGDPGQPY